MHVVRGAGETVVFVHGNGSTHRTWDRVAAAMGDDVRTVVYDLRGHSPTAPPFGDPTVADFVADLERLRETLGLSSMHVVGQSFGAFIAAAYAYAHPDRTRSLVLIAAPAGRMPAEIAATDVLVDRFRREGVMTVMRDLVGAWYTAPFLERHPDAVRERLDQIAGLDEDVFIRTYDLYGRTEIMPWLERIGTPTLVMTGELARGCEAASARNAASRMSDARALVLDGLKNGLLTEAPDEVASAIRAFVDAHAAGDIRHGTRRDTPSADPLPHEA